MLAVNTTVVVVVSPEGAGLDGVAANNVRVLHAPDAPALERAVRANEEARRTAASYFLHDADPLARVAHAWAARFEGGAPPGDLEVAVTETLARWRARTFDLPDYYLLTDPEGIAPLQRHWYLGVLGSAAPSRVVALPPAKGIVDVLPGLATGPWWPGLDRILDGIDRVVPELAGPLGSASGNPSSGGTGSTDEAPDRPSLIHPDGYRAVRVRERSRPEPRCCSPGPVQSARYAEPRLAASPNALTWPPAVVSQ